MGLLLMLTSITWAGLAIAGMFYGGQVIQASPDWLEQRLSPVYESLEIVQDILIEIVDVLVEAEHSLVTLQETTVDVSLTLTDTRPLIDDASKVITQDVPEALDGVQSSMPSLIETAAAVDDALELLSRINIVIPNLFGDDWEIGLGINYSPAVPLDMALYELSYNLEDIPEDLRSMENDFQTASSNLLSLRSDLMLLTDDIYEIDQQLQDIIPQVQDLAEEIESTQDALVKKQDQFGALLPTIRLVVMTLLSLILIGQLPAMYVGLMLIRSNQDDYWNAKPSKGE